MYFSSCSTLSVICRAAQSGPLILLSLIPLRFLSAFPSGFLAIRAFPYALNRTVRLSTGAS
jgi:hypothetical protein